MHNGKQIFDEGSVCPPDDMLIRYVSSKLNDQDFRDVELHLASCPFCSEAVEGFEMMNEDDAFELTDSVRNSIEILPEKQTRKVKVLFPWQMAAAFLLIFLSLAALWIISPKKQSEYTLIKKSVEEKKSPLPPAPPVNPEVVSSSDIKSESAVKASANTPVNNLPEMKQPPVEQQQMKENESADRDMSGVASAEMQEPAATTVIAEEVAEAPAATRNAVASQDVVKFAAKEKAVAKTVPAELFSEGAAAYKNGHYELTVNRLNDYLASGDTVYHDAALWYKSLALIGLHREKEAEPYLKKLSNGTGMYARDASERLKEIRK